MPACRCCCSTIVKPGCFRPQRDRRAGRHSSGLLKTDPAPLMHKDNARLITPGNIEDDLHRLGRRRLDRRGGARGPCGKRQALYRRLGGLRRPGSILSSNTSTIRLERLGRRDADGVPRRFS